MSAAAVGIVGYGLLGSACAERLLAASRRVVAHDVDRGRRLAMRAGGVEVADSVFELAGECGELLLTVYSAAQLDAVVEEVLARAEHDGARPRLLCATTIAPADAEALAGRAGAAGIEFVELPLSGSARRVAAGEGLALAAGEPGAIEAAGETIAAIAARTVVLGAAGSAARAKLAINLVMELNRSALAEGLALAEALGLPPRAFGEALRHSSAYSLVMEEKEPMMRAGEFEPVARAAQSLKDLRLILALGEECGQQLPLAAIQEELLESCVERGWGELDGAVVVEELRSRRRPEARPLAAAGGDDA